VNLRLIAVSNRDLRGKVLAGRLNLQHLGRRGVAALSLDKVRKVHVQRVLGNAHGQPLAGCASVRHRTHQSVPLPETRSARACSAGKAAWGCRGRICADLILCVVDAEPGLAFDSSPNTGTTLQEAQT
jgi:hypothetical protein